MLTWLYIQQIGKRLVSHYQQGACSYRCPDNHVASYAAYISYLRIIITFTHINTKCDPA